MRSIKILTTFTLTLMLGGCFIFAPPKAKFSSLPLGNDRFQLNVVTTDYIDPNALRAKALVKAAELTLEKGFKKFLIEDVDIKETTKDIIVHNPYGFQPYGAFGYNRCISCWDDPYWNFHAGYTYSPMVTTIGKTGGYLTIKMLSGKDKNALDAQEIVNKAHANDLIAKK